MAEENSIWGGRTRRVGTFLMAPLLENVDEKKLRAKNVKAAVLGIPFDGASYARTGSMYGPQAIRNAATVWHYHPDYDVNFFEKLNLHDCGDLNTWITLGDAKLTVENGASVVSEILKAGAIPVILGGEHTVTAVGTMAIDKTLKGKYGFIHFDAHLDADNELIEWYHASQVARTSEFEAFPSENMVLIGNRGTFNSKSEYQFLKENNSTLFSMRQILNIGIESVVDQALEIATRGTNGFYLTIDMDVLEAAYVPGAEAFTPFGITVRELWSVLPKLGLSDKLVAFDVVEVVPQYDPSGLTAMTAAAIIAELLAARATIVDNINPPSLEKGLS